MLPPTSAASGCLVPKVAGRTPSACFTPHPSLVCFATLTCVFRYFSYNVGPVHMVAFTTDGPSPCDANSEQYTPCPQNINRLFGLF